MHSIKSPAAFHHLANFSHAVLTLAGETVLVEGGERAVMDALLHKGPFTVSVDASSNAFRFYAGGIFHLPSCATDPKELDHAVILR